MVPIALIEQDYPVVVIAPNDGVQDRTLNAIHECKARGAKIILIHEEGDQFPKSVMYASRFLQQYRC